MVYFLCKAYDSDRQNCYFAQSLPVRGAWVEIIAGTDGTYDITKSLPVRGAWVEIVKSIACRSLYFRRSPCGERGLKSSPCNISVLKHSVAPRAGSVG